MALLALFLCFSLAGFLYALPTPNAPNLTPLVIWHGLGDSHSSSGILKFMSLIREIHPGLFIHAVHLEEDPDEEKKTGWFGNVNEQLTVVAKQLAAIPELQGGFDAMGFSQGGQFFRAYTERYNNPPVHNLITFGSQHMGISDLPTCKPYDLVCQLARNAASAGVYTSWVQDNIVPAQYYRDASRMSTYLSSNHFLTIINNEHRERHNQTYAKNIASLSNLVLVLFTEDTTVVPKESSWFGSYAPSDEDLAAPTLVPMKFQPLYVEDWIGLRQLDEAGRVQLKSCQGDHMQLSQACWQPIVKQYVGSIREHDGNKTSYGLLVQSPS